MPQLEATLAERTAAAEAARAAAVQQQGEAAIAAKESDKEMKEAVKAQVGVAALFAVRVEGAWSVEAGPG